MNAVNFPMVNLILPENKSLFIHNVLHIWARIALMESISKTQKLAEHYWKSGCMDCIVDDGVSQIMMK